VRSLRAWIVRVLGFAVRRRREADFEAELASHLQLHIDDQMRAGLSPEQARRAALVKLGGLEAVREAYGDRAGLPALEVLRRDLRDAARALRRSPAATATTLFTLALGIGACTVAFTLVHAWLLRPLSYAEPDRLVWLWESRPSNPAQHLDISTGDFTDWQLRNQVFEHVSAFKQYAFALTGSGSPERVAAQRVSADFFKTLGVEPAIGRDFTSDEDRPGANHVVMLTNEYWRSRFASDRTLVGRSVELDGAAYQVVGVLPPHFNFPLGDRADLWVPLALSAEQRSDRRDNWLNPVARLKPGVTMAQARANLAAIARQIAREHPDTNATRTASLAVVADAIADRSGSRVSWILLGATLLVLVIACANVASLALARAVDRRREMAMRLALGASRTGLVRQVLVESMVVSAAAGAVGVLVALACGRWIASLLPGTTFDRLPNGGRADADPVVLGFAAGVAILSGALLAIAPAVMSAAADLPEALRDTLRTIGSRAARRARQALIVAEVALATVVLVGSGLLTKSLVRLYQIDPGFAPGQLLTTDVHLPRLKYRSDAQVRAFFDDALDRLQAIPGIVAAGGATQLPFGGFSSGVAFTIANAADGAPRDGTARWAAVTPGYVAAMQIPLARGRMLNAKDTPGSETVCLVNDTLARRYFPNQDPVGRHLATSDVPSLTIVGVLRDVKYWKLDDEVDPEIYQPQAQDADQRLSLVVRVNGDPNAVARAVREAIWSIDKNQPVPALLPYTQLIDRRHGQARLTTMLLDLFAIVALILCTIGIAALVAYSVARQTREIGIRLALGAAPFRVQALVMRQSLHIVAAGIAIGLGAAATLTRVIASLLYDTSPTDPVTFGAVAGLFFGVGVLAAYLPARRAARVDPMMSLHAD